MIKINFQIIHRFLIFITIFSITQAKDIEYSFSVDNQTLYTKEPIILDINITQLNHSEVMLFKFSPKTSDSYIFTQIYFKENDKYHSLKHEYKYRIYPLKEGNISISFNMIKSVTTDNSVAYAISGDRDNIKSLVKTDTNEDIAPLVLNVKPTPKGTDLVGDFKLSYTIDKTTAKSYEPIYLHIELKGKGYLEPFEIIPQDKRYHIFSQKPKVTQNSIVWDYAISAKESFILPKVTLNSFNPKTKQSYTLIIPTKNIEVKKNNISSLVDKENTPPPFKGIDWSWIGWLFSYIIVFLSGFFMPRDILQKRFKRVDKSFDDKIASIKTYKELLKFLLSNNSSKYSKAIKLLESVVYNKENISLSKIRDIIRREYER